MWIQIQDLWNNCYNMRKIYAAKIRMSLYLRKRLKHLNNNRNSLKMRCHLEIRWLLVLIYHKLNRLLELLLIFLNLRDRILIILILSTQISMEEILSSLKDSNSHFISLCLLILMVQTIITEGWWLRSEMKKRN